jgi:hypothetical protein
MMPRRRNRRVLASRAALLGKHLLKRLDAGILIDRTQSPVGTSNLRIVQAPANLSGKKPQT